jgi:hypothetical protein
MIRKSLAARRWWKDIGFSLGNQCNAFARRSCSSATTSHLVLKSPRSRGNSVPGSRARLKKIARFFHHEGPVFKFFIRTDAD